MNVDLYLTPLPFSRVSLDKRTVVIIDVLRFTTSACAALMAGAKGVVPCVGPGEAGEMWSKIGADLAVLAGERDGKKIENFELGNSPLEFTEEKVGDKIVVMTTTNGTSVFNRLHNAGEVFCCGLVNVSLVANRVASIQENVAIVCAGRDGGFSIEDTLCGGMLIHLLMTTHKKRVTMSDAGSLALLLYRSNRTAIKQTIQQGEHSRFLAELGFAADVEVAAEVDSMPVLPVLREGRLIADLAFAGVLAQ
jgi:2-phosphosulfolactate phosphatase